MSDAVHKNNNDHPLGFHGEWHLMRVVDTVLQKVPHYIELGTNVGATLNYVMRNYPNISCYGCEVQPSLYEELEVNMKQFNVYLECARSFAFLPSVLEKFSTLANDGALIYMDDHCGKCPWDLPGNVKFVCANFSRGFLLIDDFVVPGMPRFVYGSYSGKKCSFHTVVQSIPEGLPYKVYYPNYQTKTSTFHPLVGWGLIHFDRDGCKELDAKLPITLRVSRGEA